MDRTQYAELYRHDGGDYIRCLALGFGWDCHEYEMCEIDCPKCKHSKKEDMEEHKMYDKFMEEV